MRFYKRKDGIRYRSDHEVIELQGFGDRLEDRLFLGAIKMGLRASVTTGKSGKKYLLKRKVGGEKANRQEIVKKLSQLWRERKNYDHTSRRPTYEETRFLMTDYEIHEVTWLHPRDLMMLSYPLDRFLRRMTNKQYDDHVPSLMADMETYGYRLVLQRGSHYMLHVKAEHHEHTLMVNTILKIIVKYEELMGVTESVLSLDYDNKWISTSMDNLEAELRELGVVMDHPLEEGCVVFSGDEDYTKGAVRFQEFNDNNTEDSQDTGVICFEDLDLEEEEPTTPEPPTPKKEPALVTAGAPKSSPLEEEDTPLDESVMEAFYEELRALGMMEDEDRR